MIENKRLRWLYKTLCVLLLSYAAIAGLLITLPDIGGNIQQTARNLFFHVPQWFTMYLMMLVSVWYSVVYIRRPNTDADCKAREAAWLGIFFGVLGLVTGSVWSRVTWSELLPDSNPSAWWPWFDPKPTAAAISVLMYLAYFILRSSVEEPTQRAKLAAIYNIFAAASLFPLTYVVPRMLGGLHPGGGEGSPVFNSGDISNAYRMVFYPAILGFMLLALWLFELRVRISRLATALQTQTES